MDGNGLERLEAAEESAAQGTAVEKIPAKAGETLLLFNPSDIDFAESASGRTALSVRGEEYACALTLEELSVRLERYGFFRCHRSYLVNMQKVQEVVRWTRNGWRTGRNPVCRSARAALMPCGGSTGFDKEAAYGGRK